MDEAVTEHVLFRNPSKTAPLVFVIVYALPPGAAPLQVGLSPSAPSRWVDSAI